MFLVQSYVYYPLSATASIYRIIDHIYIGTVKSKKVAFYRRLFPSAYEAQRDKERAEDHSAAIVIR
ncbi:hypothetical protein HQ40_09165 [Porphyromonas gulae]|nr:hypothetical protein HQ49_02500 [Porphyromonas gulae]KGN73652.1 hypothetical protein HQ40_09165 [Porphyromonas gulae]